jgi:hypothetical protein
MCAKSRVAPLCTYLVRRRCRAPVATELRYCSLQVAYHMGRQFLGTAFVFV